MARDTLKRLADALGRPTYRFDSGRREGLEAALGLSTDELLRLLVGYIKPEARCDISRFEVGTAGLTAAGEIFLGVNLEYEGASLGQTVHAEQCLVSWTRTCSASPLVALAVSAPPCGHCRQFLREFDHDGRIRLLIGDEPAAEASSLLPRAFTPLDLGVEEPFFREPLDLSGVGETEEAARRASALAYTPYSGSRAGAAVRLADGRFLAGSALENAAYNPTLPAFQAVLVSCHVHGVDLSEIEEVVFCQAKSPIDYKEQSEALALSLGVPSDRIRSVLL